MSGSLAKAIATDVFAQMTTYAETTPFAVTGFETEYQRMYVSDVENMEPAGSSDSKMQIVIAPIGGETERAGWGGDYVHCTVQLGLLLEIMVATAEVDGEKVVTDENIDAYEQFVDQLRLFLMGSRKFSTTWSCIKATPILGDHYNSHLMELSEFHVPFLLDFQFDGSAESAGV